MDSKYSFLDQDGLFNDGAAAPGDAVGPRPQGGQPPQMPAAAGGMAAGMAGPKPPVPMPPPMHQQQQQGPPPPPQGSSDGFAEALDSIARALAYTEKRVASAEARLLAALQDKPEKKPQGGGGWGGLMAIFGGLVLLFLLIGLAVACAKRSPPSQMTGVAQQVPMIVRAAPGPTPLVLSQAAAAGPPATFLS